MEGSLSTIQINKQFMVEKGLYPFKSLMLEFLASPIKAFKWKIFFEGVIKIRPDVVKLLYKGYINEEELYATVKGKKVEFGPEAINVLYGLDDNEIEHAIFKNSKE